MEDWCLVYKNLGWRTQLKAPIAQQGDTVWDRPSIYNSPAVIDYLRMVSRGFCEMDMYVLR